MIKYKHVDIPGLVEEMAGNIIVDLGLEALPVGVKQAIRDEITTHATDSNLLWLQHFGNLMSMVARKLVSELGIDIMNLQQFLK